MKAWEEGLSLLARIIVSSIFIYASYDKIWEPAKFANSVAQYELIPFWSVNAVSIIIAWLEIIIGVMLFLGFYTQIVASWASVLLIFFIGLMIYSNIVGINFDCGCFPGGIPKGIHAIGWKIVIRDLIFLINSLWLAFKPGYWGSLKPY